MGGCAQVGHAYNINSHGIASYTQAEHDNTVDQFAVAIVKDINVVGHVPTEYSRIFWYFIQKCHSNIVCKIHGSRRLSEVRGKGFEVPCEYIFTGQQKHVEKLISVFAKLGVASYCTLSLPAFFRATTLTKD